MAASPTPPPRVGGTSSRLPRPLHSCRPARATAGYGGFGCDTALSPGIGIPAQGHVGPGRGTHNRAAARPLPHPISGDYMRGPAEVSHLPAEEEEKRHPLPGPLPTLLLLLRGCVSRSASRAALPDSALAWLLSLPGWGGRPLGMAAPSPTGPLPRARAHASPPPPARNTHSAAAAAEEEEAVSRWRGEGRGAQHEPGPHARGAPLDGGGRGGREPGQRRTRVITREGGR